MTFAQSVVGIIDGYIIPSLGFVVFCIALVSAIAMLAIMAIVWCLIVKNIAHRMGVK